MLCIEEEVRGQNRLDFTKYDLDEDGAFSLSEIQRYMQKNTLQSTPLLTSQKYLLNYFNKTGQQINQGINAFNRPCPGFLARKNIRDLEMNTFSYFTHQEEESLKRHLSFPGDNPLDLESQEVLDRLQEEDLRAKE